VQGGKDNIPTLITMILSHMQQTHHTLFYKSSIYLQVLLAKVAYHGISKFKTSGLSQNEEVILQNIWHCLALE